jgi:hypothetical protein
LSQAYSAGPFNSLTGINNSGFTDPDGRKRDTDLAGFLPMPGNKLMVLYYGNSYSLLDFNKRYSYMYAQKVNVPATYDLKRVYLGSRELDPFYLGDIGLNYDEDGMIYTTAERRTVILKTVKKLSGLSWLRQVKIIGNEETKVSNSNNNIYENRKITASRIIAAMYYWQCYGRDVRRSPASEV